MKATLLLLILYTLIGRIVISELIEIKVPTEIRNSNVSETMDKAILQNYINSANHTSVSKQNSNSTIAPWLMSRNLRNGNQSPSSQDSASSRELVSSPTPTPRMPKNIRISANHSPRATAGRQMIPFGQTAYLAWNEMSVKPNQTIRDMKKSKTEKVHDSQTTDFGETSSRHRNERRKKDEINRQYDENTTYEDYTSPDNKYYSSSNYEPENTNSYTANYGSSSGQYGSGNYESYSTKNFGDYRNQQSTADYTRSPDPWSSFHRPRPNSEGYSRFTVESSNDYRAHGEPPPSLISIFFAIGSNLVQLFKIGLGSGLSLAIPIIALKIFVIPLKILTFIKIVKIILKLIFVVPFFLRVFGPSIYSAIGYHGTEFTNKMGALATPESRDVADQAGENYTWLNSLATNLTGALPEALSPKHCPSRVACELGSFLASKSNIPAKMNDYLADDDLEGHEGVHKERKNNKNEEVTTVFVRALTQRWAHDQCDVFVCGISI